MVNLHLARLHAAELSVRSCTGKWRRSMPSTTAWKGIAKRITESVRRAKAERRREASIEQIDENAGIEARDRQSASDASAAMADSPAEQGGRG